MREEGVKEGGGAEGLVSSFRVRDKLIEIRTVWHSHRNLYLPLQKHTSRVIVLETFPFPQLIGDAVITNLKGVEVGVRTADCAPVVLVGEEWVGVAHVGWRGLASGILRNLVEKMSSREKVERLFGFVGPCAKACCYEVGEEFREMFPDHLEEREGRLFMDLQRAVFKELRGAGVPDVGLLERCTVCSEELPSHRRDGSRERMLTSVRIL